MSEEGEIFWFFFLAESTFLLLHWRQTCHHHRGSGPYFQFNLLLEKLLVVNPSTGLKSRDNSSRYCSLLLLLHNLGEMRIPSQQTLDPSELHFNSVEEWMETCRRLVMVFTVWNEIHVLSAASLTLLCCLRINQLQFSWVGTYPENCEVPFAGVGHMVGQHWHHCCLPGCGHIGILTEAADWWQEQSHQCTHTAPTSPPWFLSPIQVSSCDADDSPPYLPLPSLGSLCFICQSAWSRKWMLYSLCDLPLVVAVNDCSMGQY